MSVVAGSQRDVGRRPATCRARTDQPWRVNHANVANAVRPLSLLVCASVVSVAEGHWDGPADQIGEYRVTINSLKPTDFDDNAPLGIGEEANPDIEIHTFTQAETHEGMEWVSKVFEDAPVGNVIGLGDLIYWHLDCPDSEDLQLIVDVLDLDEFPAKLLQKALEAAEGAGLNGRIVAAGSALIPLIAEMVKGNDRFGQWSSGGFTIGDDSGTHNISAGAPAPGTFGEPVGLDAGSYDFSFTAQYTEHDLDCTPCNIIETAKTISQTEAAIKEVADRLVGEAAKQGKEEAEKKRKKPVDERRSRRTSAARRWSGCSARSTTFPNRSAPTSARTATTVVLQLPEDLVGFNAARFFLLGAAAAAIKKGTVTLQDPLSQTVADAREVLKPLKGKEPDGLAVLEAITCDDTTPTPSPSDTETAVPPADTPTQTQTVATATSPAETPTPTAGTPTPTLGTPTP